MKTPWKPLAAALALAAAVAVPMPVSAAATVTNPGFESGLSGWTSTGSASYTEAGGRSGATRLAHWSQSAHQVETRQTLTGLSSGWFTARAWVRSSGSQKAAYLALRDCGGAEKRVAFPVSADGLWLRVAVSTLVSAGRCTIAVVSDANAGNWLNVDDIEFTSGRATVPFRGGDVSTLTKAEDKGGVYRTASGQAQDALKILGDNGMNLVRLKVWVNPADGYNTKEKVLAMAKRVKARGMALLVDFHYSDAWADPGQQRKPAAWAGYSFSRLTQAVHDHTYDVLSALRAQGTPADYAQVGNEINPGMLLPDGSSDNWPQLSTLLKSGASAVKAASSSTKVMLHLANGADLGTVRWWFDNAVSRGVPFDVVGLSYYGYWHGTLGALQQTLFDVPARYNKDVMVVETAYPFTMADADFEPNAFSDSSLLLPGYPATSEGQLSHLNDVATVIQAAPRTLGFVYWEPTWYAVPGNGWDPYNPSSGDGWDNQALFDWSGRALHGITVFNR